MNRLTQRVDQLFSEQTVRNLAVKVGRGDEVLCEICRSGDGAIDSKTLSDATVSTVKKYGKENYGEVMQMRHGLREAIKWDLGDRL